MEIYPHGDHLAAAQRRSGSADKNRDKLAETRRSPREDEL